VRHRERSSYEMTSEWTGEDLSDADGIARSSAQLYDGIVDWYVDAFFDDMTDADWLDAWIRELPACATVADVGAGPGNFAKYVSEAGFRVLSTDISLEMVRASARLVPKAPAFVSDMRALPLRDATLDGVLCAYSLLHVPSPANAEVLAEFARILAPSGLLQLMVKTGTRPYRFESTLVPGASSLMEPWRKNDLLDRLRTLGIDPIRIDHRPASSPHEFDHPKLMVIGRKR
jgi:SAM-dependent methyltransferase